MQRMNTEESLHQYTSHANHIDYTSDEKLQQNPPLSPIENENSESVLQNFSKTSAYDKQTHPYQRFENAGSTGQLNGNSSSNSNLVMINGNHTSGNKATDILKPKVPFKPNIRHTEH